MDRPTPERCPVHCHGIYTGAYLMHRFGQMVGLRRADRPGVLLVDDFSRALLEAECWVRPPSTPVLSFNPDDRGGMTDALLEWLRKGSAVGVLLPGTVGVARPPLGDGGEFLWQGERLDEL